MNRWADGRRFTRTCAYGEWRTGFGYLLAADFSDAESAIYLGRFFDRIKILRIQDG